MAKLENKAKENPKLEQNVLSDGRISLYLEYYLGREEIPVLDENGNPVLYETGKMAGKPKVHIKHNRRKENLQLYLIAKPRTPAERQQNKETLELAAKIRAEREQQFKESMLGYRLKKDRNINFLDYYQAYIDSYTKKDLRMIKIALNRFKDFLKEQYPAYYTFYGSFLSDLLRYHACIYAFDSQYTLLFEPCIKSHDRSAV